MQSEKNTNNRGEGGLFLKGHNIKSPGRPSAVPKDIKEYFKKDLRASRVKIKAVANGKKLIIYGKQIEYNENFWLDCVKWCHAMGWGRPSMQVEIKDVTPPMSNEEKQVRSGQIDSLALTRAKAKLKTIDVDSESK